MRLIFFAVSILAVSLLLSPSLASWQVSGPFFYGKSNVEIPSIIYPEETAKFSINLQYEKGPAHISEMKSIIDIYPQSAASHVRIETEPVGTVLRPISSATINGTITVDSTIPADMIYLAIYFEGKDVSGITYTSGWTYHSQPIKVEIRELAVLAKLDRGVFVSPLKQIKAGIPVKEVRCKENLLLVLKPTGTSAACVRALTAHKLVERGWAISSLPENENKENLIVLKEGQREGPLLVQKILPSSVVGIQYRAYPVCCFGSQVTLYKGDIASNGCTHTLTLVKIENNTATFLEKDEGFDSTRCPICLSGDTTIDTPVGNINVKELKVGMQVWTKDSLGHKQAATILKVGKILVSSTHKMVHLILDDGRELFASLGHPTADGRLLENISVGDTLDNSRVKSVEQIQYNENYTYDILPSGSTGFYWANEILVGSTLK